MSHPGGQFCVPWWCSLDPSQTFLDPSRTFPDPSRTFLGTTSRTFLATTPNHLWQTPTWDAPLTEAMPLNAGTLNAGTPNAGNRDVTFSYCRRNLRFETKFRRDVSSKRFVAFSPPTPPPVTARTCSCPRGVAPGDRGSARGRGGRGPGMFLSVRVAPFRTRGAYASRFSRVRRTCGRPPSRPVIGGAALGAWWVFG